MERRARVAFFGAGALVLSVAATIFVVRPSTTIAAEERQWTNTPGVAPEADDCREEKCLCFERAGAERICLTDEELGRLVRRMGAICTSDDDSRQSLQAVLDTIVDERRLGHR